MSAIGAVSGSAKRLCQWASRATSTDPLFVDKVRDIVGLYLDPRYPLRKAVLRNEQISVLMYRPSGIGLGQSYDDSIMQRLRPSKRLRYYNCNM